MQRAAAQSRIDTNRFEMGSKNNPTTVAGEAIRDLRTDDSRGTEAATAASARAVQLRELWPRKVFSCGWILDWCEL